MSNAAPLSVIDDEKKAPGNFGSRGLFYWLHKNVFLRAGRRSDAAVFARQNDGEGGALSGRALDTDCAAVGLHDAVNDGEPQPGAALLGGEDSSIEAFSSSMISRLIISRSARVSRDWEAGRGGSAGRAA